MSIEKLKNTFVPSILSGVVGIGAYYFLYDKEVSASIPLGPINVPVGFAVGATVAIGNTLGELTTQYLTPMIPKNESFENIEEHVIPPVLAGLGSYVAMRVLVSEDTLFTPAMVVGVSGSVGGKYIYGML